MRQTFRKLVNLFSTKPLMATVITILLFLTTVNNVFSEEILRKTCTDNGTWTINCTNWVAFKVVYHPEPESLQKGTVSVDGKNYLNTDFNLPSPTPEHSDVEKKYNLNGSATQIKIVISGEGCQGRYTIYESTQAYSDEDEPDDEDDESSGKCVLYVRLQDPVTTYSKDGDTYTATCSIKYTKKYMDCDSEDYVTSDPIVFKSATGTGSCQPMAKCMAENALSTKIKKEGGLCSVEVDCDDESKCTANSKSKTAKASKIQKCDPCAKGGNHGEQFKNGFPSCASCSGGTTSLGGHYYIRLTLQNSEMGYGWRNDFNIQAGKILATDGTESYMIYRGGKESAFFSRDTTTGVFNTSDVDNRAQIVNVDGQDILRVKIGDNAYEFPVPGYGASGIKKATKSAQIVYEEKDTSGNYSYKGYSLTFTYDTSNLLTRVENESGEFYTFEYNTEGLLETVKDANAETVRSFIYDANHNLTSRWQKGYGTTTFTYTTINGNSHLLTGINKPGGESTAYSYTAASSSVDAFDRTVAFADTTDAATTYSGPQTIETYHYVDGGSSYTEYQRPLFESGGTMQYAVSKVYDPVEVDHSEFGVCNKHETLNEDGSTTISYIQGQDGLTLWSQTIGTDGTVKTTQNEYYSDSKLKRALTLYTNNFILGSSGESYYYNDEERLTASKEINGIIHVIKYRTLADGTTTDQVIETWDEAYGTGWMDYGQYVKGNRVTNEYYADDAPAYRRFRLWKKTRHLNSSTTYTIEYDYIQTDSDNPQNIGRLAKKTYPDGSYEEWTYGCCDIATYRNRSGATTTYVRDAAGRLTSQTDPSGAVTTYTYDDAGRVLTTTIPAGGTITNTYDAQGNLTRTDYPDSTYTTSTYSSTGMLMSTRNRAGLVVNYEYSSTTGQLIRTYTAEGNLQQITYDGLGRQKTTTDARGLVRTYHYDDENSSGTPFGNVWYISGDYQKFIYNDLNLLTTHYARNNAITSYEYDALARPAYVYTPSGLEIDNTYDALSRKTSVTYMDMSGAWYYFTDTYSYNADNQLTQVSYGNGTSESYAYTNGQRTSYTDKAGKTWTYTYTAAGQPDQVQAPDSLGVVSDTDYAANGQVSSVTGANGVQVSYTYNNLGQVTRQTMPDSTYTEYVYGPSGPTSIFDRDGRETVITYNTYGRKTKVKSPKGDEVEYGYNLAGDLTSLTDENDKTTGWTYDTRGLMTVKTMPDSSTYTYDYHNNWVLDYFVSPNGHRSGFTYNKMGQVTQIYYQDGYVANFTYDGFGNMLEMTDPAGTTAWSYDDYARLNGVDGPFSNDAIAYSRDTATGRISSMTLNSGNAVTYTYDSAGRINGVSANGNAFAYSYLNLSSQVAELTRNTNSVVANTFDTLGRLTNKLNKFANGSTVNSYAYTLNNADERTKVTLADGKYIDYSYNADGELTGAQRCFSGGVADNSYSYGFNYDPAGNPLQRSTNGQTRNYTFNSTNEFTSATAPGATNVFGKAAPSNTAPFVVTVNGFAATVNGDSWCKTGIPLTEGSNSITVNITDKYNRTASQTVSVDRKPAPVFTYDVNGNMTSDGRFTYTWNDANRLTTITQAETSKETYTYDGLGRRVTKKTYSWDSETSTWTLDSEQHFVYNGWNLIAELDESDNLSKSYVWGIDISGSEQGAGGVGGLLMASDGSVIHFPAYDGNGNITAYTDGSSALAASYEYSPFGALTASSGSTFSPFRFSTKCYNTLTGLYYYGFRYYSPRFARWINRDPIGEEGGINLYGMVGNDAVNWADDSGLIRIIVNGREVKHSNSSASNSASNSASQPLADKTPKYSCSDVGGEDKNGTCCCKDKEMDEKSECCEKGKVVKQKYIVKCKRAMSLYHWAGVGRIPGAEHVAFTDTDTYTGMKNNPNKEIPKGKIYGKQPKSGLGFLWNPGIMDDDTKHGTFTGKDYSGCYKFKVCPAKYKKLLSQGSNVGTYTMFYPFGESWGNCSMGTCGGGTVAPHN